MLRLLLLLLVVILPIGTHGLGLSSVAASEDAAVDATPIGPDSPPGDDVPPEGETPPPAEPTDAVPTETATVPSVEVTPTATVPADTPPAPEGSPEATADSTPAPVNTLTCDVPKNPTIVPGGTFDLSCLYTINDPDALAGVSASFATMPGAGWLVMVAPAEEADGAKPVAEQGDWIPEPDQAAGSASELTVRVVAPDDATSGQIATVHVGLDGGAAQIASVDLTVDASDFNVANVETVEGINCSTYSSPRPLGWNQAIVYACTFDAGIASFPANSFVRYSFDDGADETASWGLGAPTLNPASLPGSRYPGTSTPGTALGGLGSPLTVYFPVWTPFSANSATDAAGTISLTLFCTPELQCDPGSGQIVKTLSARFTVTIGESSNQNGDASLTCQPGDGGAAYVVSYSARTVINCTIEALVDDLSFVGVSGTVPNGWLLHVHISGIVDLSTIGAWGFHYGPGNYRLLAKGEKMTFSVDFAPTACGITSTSIPPITMKLETQVGSDGVTELNLSEQLTTDPSNVSRPSSASFDLSSFNFGAGSWNKPAGGTIVSTFRVLPPSCLPTGTTQQVSLSVTGNGNSFRSTSGGTLALSQLKLSSLFSDSPYPDAMAAPTTLPTDLTTSQAVVSITATGGDPRVFAIGLTLLAPAGTPPGTYSATITLDITGGSD